MTRPRLRSALGKTRGRYAALGRPGEALLVGALCIACAAWVLRLWRADLALPLRYAPVDDTKFYLMLVKGIIEHGWYLSNANLGAPFAQHLSDYPQGADNLNLLFIRGLALFSSNPALVVNEFLLLTFALAGISSHLVLRSQGISAPVAGVISVLFSLLAYHFFRGESHLLLSAYYGVPLAAYLFLGVLGDRPLFVRRAAPRARMLVWASGRSMTTIALCVVIGSDNLYYATFAVLMLLGAVAVALVLRRGRAACGGAAAIGLVAITLGANLAPSLLYRAAHGSNPLLQRSAAVNETSNEAFALRLTNLVLPSPNNRIAPLRHFAMRYDNAIAPGYCDACYASLGTVGTVGFVWLALCALGTLAGGAAGWQGGRRRFRHAGAGVALALAVGTVGGLSSLIEFFVTADLRGWNRISVFIAFLSLLAAALLLDSFVLRLRARRWGGKSAALVLTGVLLFGVYDQTSGSFAPDYATVGREYRSDATFVAAIQARLPRGASVFQLPYVPFPEGYPDTAVSDQVATYATKYEPLRGYIHSTSLRWSFGAIKGRPDDWAAQLAGRPLSFVVAAVAATGFDGIWVDPAGFEPAKAQNLRTALRTLLGVAPLISPDRDLWFFDLRAFHARLAQAHARTQLQLLRALTLTPLRTACATDGVALVNPSPVARAATLTLYLAHRTLHRHLIVEPGRRVVRLSAATTHAPARLLYSTLADDAVATFEQAGPVRPGALVAGLTGPPCPR